MFARPSPKRTVQVLADPGRGVAAPYAIVERFYANARSVGGTGKAEINGRHAFVYVGRYGQGSVDWTLADGSESYVRTRGFDTTSPNPIQAAAAAAYAANPIPVRIPMSGTSSIAGLGVNPKPNATSSGAMP